MRQSRGRMINVDISDSHGFASLKPEAAVLFCMLIPHFNAHGKMSAGTGTIKETVCPRVSYLTTKNIPTLLAEISSKTSVKYFEYDGRCYLHSLKFLNEHQTLRTDRLGPDLLPDYSGTNPGILQSTPTEVKGKKKIKEGEDKGEIQYQEVVDYLNLKAGTNYRANSADTREHIAARWKEGANLSDFKMAIDNMTAKWLNDPKMCQYLRPATLFARGKFEGYVNQIITKNEREAGLPLDRGMLSELDEFDRKARSVK